MGDVVSCLGGWLATLEGDNNMWRWLKCLVTGGHMWYLPNDIRKRFNKINIYKQSLMRHSCKKCGVEEDNSWAYDV